MAVASVTKCVVADVDHTGNAGLGATRMDSETLGAVLIC